MSDAQETYRDHRCDLAPCFRGRLAGGSYPAGPHGGHWSTSRKPSDHGCVHQGPTLTPLNTSQNGRLVISEEVEHALSAGDPVVALESTIITHGPQTRLSPNHGLYLTGMPHPTNLSTAISLEGIIRSHSSIPATIALLDGKVHVGLSKAQLARLADPANGENAVKVSRRDIGATLAMRRMGGTTVAGTMFVASSVGIQVFVTGGIGGVHRGAESSER